jgi:cytochrome P450
VQLTLDLQLRVEIDIKAANNEISNPVTFAEAQKMPYLQAVIKEGLRIHPVTGLPLARVVPSGGANISDVCFPQGVSV